MPSIRMAISWKRNIFPHFVEQKSPPPVEPAAASKENRMDRSDFLPVSREDMEARDWWYYDFLVVTADAYVDHPSFGTAIIARVLEAEGYRVAVLAQPDWHSADAFRAMGKPR